MKRLGILGAGLALVALPAMSTAAVNVLHNGDFSGFQTINGWDIVHLNEWGGDPKPNTLGFGSGFGRKAWDIASSGMAPVIGDHVLAMNSGQAGGQHLRENRFELDHEYKLAGNIASNVANRNTSVMVEIGYTATDNALGSFVSLASAWFHAGNSWAEAALAPHVIGESSEGLGKQILVRFSVLDGTNEAIFDDFSLMVSPASAEPIPEPLTLLALGLGAAGWAGRRRRR